MEDAATSTALAHRTARQSQAHEKLCTLVHQWLLARCPDLPAWRAAVLGIEQLVDGDDLVLRFRIPGVSGLGPMDAAVSGPARYVVVQAPAAGGVDKSGLVLHELRSGTPVQGFGIPHTVTPGEIEALQIDGVLEVRMPRTGRRWGRGSHRHRFLLPGT
jgi:HSP20 family molecular chaperone IbpA